MRMRRALLLVQSVKRQDFVGVEYESSEGRARR
jgi:hypothetical protein